MPVYIIFILHGQFDGLHEKLVYKFSNPHIKFIVIATVQYNACLSAVDTDKKVFIVCSSEA